MTLGGQWAANPLIDLLQINLTPFFNYTNCMYTDFSRVLNGKTGEIMTEKELQEGRVYWLSKLPEVSVENQRHLDRYKRFIISRPFRQHKKDFNFSLEEHHIYPYSFDVMSDVKDNLILLTVREHYIAHLILWKCYESKMVFAFNMMTNFLKYNTRLTSREYENLKKSFSEKMSSIKSGCIQSEEHIAKRVKAITGLKRTEEQNIATRERQLGDNHWTKKKDKDIVYKILKDSGERRKGKYKGVKKPEGHGAKVSAARKGKCFISEDGKRKIGEAVRLRGKTEEECEAISKRVSGEGNPAFGTKMINNGVVNKRISKDSKVPLGWVLGQKKRIKKEDVTNVDIEEQEVADNA